MAWIGGTALLCTTTLVLAAFLFVDYQREQREQLDRLHQSVAGVSRHLTQVLTLPLWDLDVAQIDQIVTSIMEGDENLQAVLVEDMRHPGVLTGWSRDRTGKPSPASSPPAGEGLSVRSWTLVHQGSAIGSLSIWSTDRFTRQTLTFFLINRATAILTVNVLLVVTLGIVFRRTILLPVHAMEAYAGRVSQGEEDVSVGCHFFPEELESLRSSIERMVGMLTTRYRELTASQAALAAAEERYRSIFEGALEGIYQTKPDGTILTINPAMARMFGYDTVEAFQEEVGNSRALYVDPTDRERYVAQLLQDDRIHNFEARFRRKDNVTVWLASTTRLVRDATGEPLYISGMVQDITERRRAMEALRESEARFRVLFENAPLPYQSLDANGCYLDVNHNWLQTLGYERSEVLGRSFADFLGPDSREAFSELFCAFKRNGACDGAEFDLAKKNGGMIRVLLYGRVQSDEKGRFLRTHCIFTDITERKKVEDVLREKEAQLRIRLDYLLSSDEEIDKLNFSSVLDVSTTQSLLEIFHELTGMAVGLYETDGKCLAAAGRQDICTKFHRVHPRSRRQCIESDTRLNNVIGPGEYQVYKCANSLWEVATPICVGNKHVGNILAGQFFFENEGIDQAVFLAQAREYGFDQEAYLEALGRVPRMNPQRVASVMRFFMQFAELVSRLGYNNLKLSKSLWRQKRVEDELRRHRDELAANQGKLNLAMSMAHLAPWEYDYASDTYLFDDHFFALYGTSCAREGGGRMTPEIYAREFMFPDAAGLVRQGLAAFLLPGAPDAGEAYEHRIRRRDGQLRSIVARGVVIRDASGRAVKVIGANQDITERKLAEEALRESEEKYRVLVESANDAVFLHAVSDDGWPGLFAEVNETACRRLGYSREELCRMSPMQLDAADSQGHIPQAMESLLQKNAAVFETIHLAADGRRIPVEVSARLIELRGQRFVLSFARDITERKQAEEALRASEERYRYLYLTTPVMLHSMDTEGRLVAVSDAWCQKLGYAREEVLGRSVLDFITDDSKRIAREISWPRFYATGRVEDISYQFITKDGQLVDVLLTAKAERDASGAIIRSLAVLVDVTHRKRAEDALRASEARYRLLIETIPMGVAVVTPQLRVVSMNAKMREWAPDVDVASRPLCFRSFNDPPMESPCPWCPVVKALEDDGIHESLTATPWKGATRIYRIIACPLHDERGETTAVIELVEDISDRMATEEALRRSEVKYRTLLDNIPLNIVYKDADSVILGVNKHCAELFGGRPEDFNGKTDFDFCDSALAAKFQADDRRIMATGIAEEYDEVHHFKGQERIIHTIKTPILDEQGRIESVMAIFWDVTETRRTETALREAEKMAAMGNVAGGVAHDFNNILGSIANLALLAAQDVPMGSDARQDLEQILESANVGKELVRQILTFCRPDKEIRRVFDPAPEVAKTLKLLKPSFPTEIVIEEEFAEGTCVILADPSQFRQIVLNLCSNAVDAMRGTPGTLSVGLEQVTLKEGDALPHPALAPARYVALRVSDTGSGIDPSIKDRIFEPFFSSKSKGHGTGLGLAVVHGIICRHGGAVTVQSHLGQGSVFTVYLPYCDMDEDLPEILPSVLVRGEGGILLVDDDKMQAATGRRLLEKIGYRVTVCGDGAMALSVLRNNPTAFDLLLTDLTMPNLDGASLARETLALRPNMPIIMCTGNSGTFPPDEARKLGIKDYICKPVDWNRLSVIIAGLLQKR